MNKKLGRWTSELIDTLWNVNNWGSATREYTCSELIDTLWNVNGLTKLKHNMALAMELIDTLWNVND